MINGEQRIVSNVVMAGDKDENGNPKHAMIFLRDVTDSKNPKPVFSYLPESDIGKLQKKVNELQAANEELSSTMDSLLTEVIPDLMRVE